MQYIDEYGKTQRVPIWYDIENCMFNVINPDKTSKPIPPSRVFISTRINDIHPIIPTDYSLHFKRFTNIYVDMIDGPFPIMLHDKILSINRDMKVEFDQLKSKSQDHLISDHELPLKTKILINCSDGVSIPFYPYAVKIFYDLDKSPFNIQNFDINYVTLDYSSDIIKPLLMIFYSDVLPPNLINMIELESDWLSIYAELSDMLGFIFFSKYFKTIISSDEYKSMLI